MSPSSGQTEYSINSRCFCRRHMVRCAHYRRNNECGPLAAEGDKATV